MNIFGLTFTAAQLYILGICGALILALIGFHITDTLNRKTRHITASYKFRSTMLTELAGIIPVEGIWNQEVYTRIQNSIPTIKRAAIEFYPAIPFIRKGGFNKAVIEYCEKSENINWEQAILDAVNETEYELTQKGKFVQCVCRLLSFTE